ncbi:MAG: response regulator transcription factor, partial [Saprospiraceae bacterium]|nr:response regulator transcription factor [Saprospiraceae bacterium]
EIGYTVSGIAHDVPDALTHIRLEQPDLVLLDINLEGEKDGVFVAHHLHETGQIPFIFLTSLSDRKTLDRAKRTGPSGYLVKPVDEGDLRTSVEVALYNHRQARLPRERKFLIKDALFIKDQYRLIKVPVADILFAEASNNYCYIHTASKKYVLSLTLKAVASKLAEREFIRIHRTYMINPVHIDEISGRTVRIGEHELPISRSYHDQFMQYIDTL